MDKEQTALERLRVAEQWGGDIREDKNESLQRI